jgi:hypothetical protein
MVQAAGTVEGVATPRNDSAGSEGRGVGVEKKDGVR